MKNENIKFLLKYDLRDASINCNVTLIGASSIALLLFLSLSLISYFQPKTEWNFANFVLNMDRCFLVAVSNYGPNRTIFISI